MSRTEKRSDGHRIFEAQGNIRKVIFVATSGVPLPTGEIEAQACPKCHGGGYVRRDLPREHPEFGKAVPCECTLTPRAEVPEPVSGPLVGRLLVEFKGGATYVYTDVPESAYEQLLGADELQKVFNDVVKAPGYQYERVA